MYVDFQEYTRIIGIPSSEKSPVEYVNEGIVMKEGGWNREGWEDGQWDVRESRVSRLYFAAITRRIVSLRSQFSRTSLCGSLSCLPLTD